MVEQWIFNPKVSKFKSWLAHFDHALQTLLVKPTLVKWRNTVRLRGGAYADKALAAMLLFRNQVSGVQLLVSALDMSVKCCWRHRRLPVTGAGFDSLY